MFLKNFVFLALVGLCSSMALRADEPKEPVCPTESSCLDFANSCPCYCSHKCGSRAKDEKEDQPVFVPNDPHKKYCYCKPWDRDEFEKRCQAQEEESKKE